MFGMLLRRRSSGPLPPPATEYRVKTGTGGTFGNDGWITSGSYREGVNVDGRTCFETGYGLGPTAITEKVYPSDFGNAEISLIGMRTNAYVEWHASIGNYPLAGKSVRIRVTGWAGWMHFNIDTFVDDVQVHTHSQPVGVVDWLLSASIVKTGTSFAIKVNGTTVHTVSNSHPMNHYRATIYGDPSFRAYLDDIGYLAPL